MEHQKLKQFIEEVSDTCLVKIVNQDNTGVIFFKNGQIINTCFNGRFGKKNTEDILNLTNSELTKIKIDSVTKFQSEDFKYILDLIEFVGISSDLYVKHEKKNIVLSFSVGCLVSILPEVPDVKSFLIDLMTIKGMTYRMKLSSEKPGYMKIFIHELLNE